MIVPFIPKPELKVAKKKKPLRNRIPTPIVRNTSHGAVFAATEVLDTAPRRRGAPLKNNLLRKVTLTVSIPMTTDDKLRAEAVETGRTLGDIITNALELRYHGQKIKP